MTTNRRFAMIALLTLALALALPMSARAAQFLPLGDLPGGWTSSEGNDVSANGLVAVGSGESDLGGDSIRWTHETGSVGFANPLTDRAHAVSADGSVIVGVVRVDPPSPRNDYEAYRWTEATGMVRLGDLPGGDLVSSATDVSDDGAIVVGAGHRDVVYESQEAFRWTVATGMVGLGDLPGGHVGSSALAISNDGRVIVGSGNSAFGVEAVRWTDDGGIESLRPLTADDGGSSANGVNSDGSVIVGINWVGSRSGGEAFRWTQQTGMVGLGDLPGGEFFSEAAAVSADGAVIVGTSDSEFGESDLDRRDAFLWDAAQGMRNLRELLISDYGLADELAGWRLSFATGISADDRTIVGTGVNPQGEMEGWVARLEASALPEPSTIVLLAGGIATAAAARLARRRRRA